MLKIKKLISRDFVNCYNLLKTNQIEYEYFNNLGWTIKEFENQFLKKIFYGQGLYIDKKLTGFVFGDLISIKNIIDYEILLIYISKENRNLGYATTLFKSIQFTLKKYKLNKIYLEVAANNAEAINFYIKNGYKKTGTRKEYYSIQNNKVDSYLFEKGMNE